MPVTGLFLDAGRKDTAMQNRIKRYLEQGARVQDSSECGLLEPVREQIPVVKNRELPSLWNGSTEPTSALQFAQGSIIAFLTLTLAALVACKVEDLGFKPTMPEDTLWVFALGFGLLAVGGIAVHIVRRAFRPWLDRV